MCPFCYTGTGHCWPNDETTLSQKKLDPFSFEHNFGNCCLILIILSLLQIKINCVQEYREICHHTSNLLVH